MAIPRETVDKVRDAVDIVDVIKEYIPNLQKAGKDYRSLCPFHQDKKPSFYVSPSKNIFHCFGCQTGGDVFKFLMKYDNLTYPEAIKKLAARAGIEIVEIDVKADTERSLILEVLEQASLYYHRYLLESPEAEAARAYIAKRGIRPETVEEFRLGYAPSGNKFFELARKKYNVDVLLKTGLVKISDRDRKPFSHLRGRIVFPIFSFQGRVIAFGGRVLPEEQLPSQPVYLNTFETMVFSKSKSLYGLYQASKTLRTSRTIAVLEGYMDVILCHQEGMKNTVAPLGTALTSEQVRIMKRYADNIYMIFDPDESGIKASIRAGELCLEEDIKSRLVMLPEHTDPDQYILKNGKDAFDKLLTEGLNPVEFKFNYCLKKHDIKQAEGKRDLTRDMIETIKKISDPIIRQEMIKYVASKLGLTEQIIISELRKSYKSTLKKGKSATEPAFGSISIKIRSVEEEIIWLCLQHPNLCRHVPVDALDDPRCSKVLPLLMQMQNEGATLATFLDSLEENLANWLTRLSFEERHYASDYPTPERALESLIKDITSRRQEEKRRSFEIDFISMFEDKTVDPSKVEEFIKLTKSLKGSKTN